jgi:hypothetical protein
VLRIAGKRIFAPAAFFLNTLTELRRRTTTRLVAAKHSRAVIKQSYSHRAAMS